MLLTAALIWPSRYERRAFRLACIPSVLPSTELVMCLCCEAGPSSSSTPKQNPGIVYVGLDDLGGRGPLKVTSPVSQSFSNTHLFGISSTRASRTFQGSQTSQVDVDLAQQGTEKVPFPRLQDLCSRHWPGYFHSSGKCDVEHSGLQYGVMKEVKTASASLVCRFVGN